MKWKNLFRRARGAAMSCASSVKFYFSEPKRRGTNLVNALEFMARVTAHRAITVVVSDFLECGDVSRFQNRATCRPVSKR